MTYRLQLNLTNPGVAARTVVIYGGTIFEVVDPFSETQNLVATTNTTVTVPPGTSQAVEIDTWCLNSSFAPPRDTKMQATVMSTIREYSSQGELWTDMNRRR